jgi:hypothetical protein
MVTQQPSMSHARSNEVCGILEERMASLSGEAWGRVVEQQTGKVPKNPLSA